MHDLEGLFCKTVNSWIIAKTADKKKHTIWADTRQRSTRMEKRGCWGVASPWAKPRLVEMGAGPREDRGPRMEWSRSMLGTSEQIRGCRCGPLLDREQKQSSGVGAGSCAEEVTGEAEEGGAWSRWLGSPAGTTP